MLSRTDTIIASWSDNAALWTRAVRESLIASRRQITDAAILSAVRAAQPRRLLDVGCGEGWLCRALHDTGATITGIDASPELVARAREGGSGTFFCLAYKEVATATETVGSGFDTIVCNFSLLDDEISGLLAHLARIAAPKASLLIQTVHPFLVGPPYEDEWRTERFESFDDTGWTAMPWFFRTLGSWIGVVSESWVLRSVEEPRAPGADLPASMILVATRRDVSLTIRPE